MKRKVRTAIAAVLMLNIGTVWAADIQVEQAWTRATPKGAGVAVGYLTIHNASATSDRLTGGSAEFARAAEVHEMSMANGIMKMREVAGGLAIPAHGTVMLSPRGYHLMFAGLKRQLRKGETVTATLTFDHAGPVGVEFMVGGIADMRPGGPAKAPAGGDMGGMKM